VLPGVREVKNNGRRRWWRQAGLVVGLVWASLWTAFAAASAWSQGFGPVLGDSLAASAVLISGIVLLWGGVAVAWKRAFIGGFLLVTASFLVMAGYSLSAADRVAPPGIFLIVLTMGIPPLAAGVFYLLLWREERGSSNP
jgi:hypothetical protein